MSLRMKQHEYFFIKKRKMFGDLSSFKWENILILKLIYGWIIVCPNFSAFIDLYGILLKNLLTSENFIPFPLLSIDARHLASGWNE